MARAIFEANGGLAFLQEAVLLGAIYGHVDWIVRADELFHRSARDSICQIHPTASGGSPAGSAPSELSLPASSPAVPDDRAGLDDAIVARSRDIRFETVEAPRAIPLLDPWDYRKLSGYVLHYRRWLNEVEDASGGFLSRVVPAWLTTGLGTAHGGQRATAEVVEIVSASHRQVYEDGALIVSEPHALGLVPVVHVQHGRQPFVYAGQGEVEPLIPLQNELNTRLSDRANRVTLQCFKMYLGRNIDGFGEWPVGPGQMWMTDHPEASIEAHGRRKGPTVDGDAAATAARPLSVFRGTFFRPVLSGVFAIGTTLA